MSLLQNELTKCFLEEMPFESGLGRTTPCTSLAEVMCGEAGLSKGTEKHKQLHGGKNRGKRGTATDDCRRGLFCELGRRQAAAGVTCGFSANSGTQQNLQLFLGLSL